MRTEPLPSTSCGLAIVPTVQEPAPAFVSSTCAIRWPAAPSQRVIRAERLAGSHDPIVADGLGRGELAEVGDGAGLAETAGALGTADGVLPTRPFGPGRPRRMPARTTATMTRPVPARVAPDRPLRTTIARGGLAGRRAVVATAAQSARSRSA